MKLSIVLLACTLAQLTSLTARADDWVIEHVTLIDGIHQPQSDMTVAIEGERIVAVTPSAMAHSLKGRRIAGNGKFLIPGLMDVHIHLRGGFYVRRQNDAPLRPPNQGKGGGGTAKFFYFRVNPGVRSRQRDR